MDEEIMDPEDVETPAEPIEEAPAGPTVEERRDERIAALVEAGLVVTGSTPMATVDEPHVVAGYRLAVLDPTNRTTSRLDNLRSQTEIDLADMIEWTPAPYVEPEPTPEPEVSGPEEGDDPQYDEGEAPAEEPAADPEE